MTTGRRPEPFRLTSTDVMILIVGALGLLAFVVFLPGLHPDGAASYEISEQEATDRANVFLSAQGFSVDAFEVQASLVRDVDLLTDLQDILGRSDASDFLASSAAEAVPGYFWKVLYRLRDPNASDDDIFVVGQEVFQVHLNQSGAVLGFTNDTDNLGAAARRFGSSLNTINRSALAAIASSDTGGVAATRARLSALPDTTLLNRLRFDTSPPLVPLHEEDRLRLLENQQLVLVDSSGIENLVNYHLGRTALRDITWRTDSLSVPPGNAQRTARVTLVSSPPIAGQIVVARAEVTATGTLRALNVEYNPDRDRGSILHSVMRFIQFGGYALLALIIIVVFFRRLVARLVDVKSAMLDAVIVGTTFGGTFILAEQLLFQGAMWPLWALILLRIVIFSVVAGAVSLFVFLLSGVTDSLSRDRFPGKLRTLVLFRHGDVQNVPFGAMLFRGIFIGGSLLGVVTLGMMVFDDLQPRLIEMMLLDTVYRPVVADVAGGFAISYLTTMLLLMSFGVVAYRISSKPIVIIPLVALGTMLLQISPSPVHMTQEGIIVSALSGLIIAATFYKYDLMTVLVALFVSSVLWSQKEGLLVSGSAAWIDFLLTVLLLTSLVVFALIAILSGRSGRDLKEYVPEYVTEMAGQERVKRELEIAYQVQATFLPRTMPRIAGLDLAGMCLPANEVGGDYYDFIELDEQRVAFVIGDVSGKGIHASFYMTLVKGILQTLAREKDSPAEVMRRLNHLFCINVPSGTFISMIYGVVDVGTGAFTFARAGHNPAILRRASEESYEFLRPAGMAIGFQDGQIFDNGIEEKTVMLKPGDALVLYTDGFSEAMNSRRDLYGDERLAEKVAQVGSRSASAILRLLTEDVHHFIEGMGRSDDMTMVVVKLKQDA